MLLFLRFFITLFLILMACSSHATFKCSELFPNSKAPNHLEVGQRIVELLTQGRVLSEAKVTQTDLAELLGVTQSYISKVLNGTQSLSQYNAQKVADFVRMDLGVLFAPKDASESFWMVNGSYLKNSLKKGIFFPSGKLVTYTQMDLATLLGVNQATISKIINGQIALSPEKARALESFFAVENGWLTGSGPTIHQPTGKTPVRRNLWAQHPSAKRVVEFNGAWKYEVGRRIKSVMRASSPRKTQVDIATLLNVGQSYVSKIINGKEAIGLENAKVIADYFNVELSWLLATDIISKNANLLMETPSTYNINYPNLIATAKHFDIVD